MRNYELETQNRVEFIRNTLSAARADGIVYGNSGGNDSALVGILCKMACENTVGLIMPCGSKRNYVVDKEDADALAKQYGIATRVVDLSIIKTGLVRVVDETGLLILRLPISHLGSE